MGGRLRFFTGDNVVSDAKRVEDHALVLASTRTIVDLGYCAAESIRP